ncbi:MAG: ArsR family transcriptional regulator [Gemmatimonadales bacterium]|nr:ArsR family transcriptional regulator [Gemmatimonadales bacterium]NIN10420.1 ArsR family transcriptional regulator [Gemmatimonadales bacterium]NIN49212.1 ArsR family transcriptional regulator [Gemmatimonadales bacterium]NIP06676.1 ArsR family transcriptional regulator [Gemmatimonadales bacterium]NIR00007.1 ArsR family transcriptional regulator [Gemmatimonadales bacterium]
MTQGVGDREGSKPLAHIDRVIHEPARLMIMALLSVVESADFLFIVRQTGLTLGNLSSHLSKLEAAGYVEVEKRFKGKKPHTMLRLTEPGRAAFQAYRQNMEQVLGDRPAEETGDG